MRALEPTADKNVAYSSFVLTSTGLLPIGTPSFEAWEEVGHFLKKATTDCALWLGDCINYAHARFGEKYLPALARTGLDYGTLRNASYTSRRIHLSDRSDKLSYKHHEIVASLPAPLQRQLLREAEWGYYSIRELKQRALEVKKAQV